MKSTLSPARDDVGVIILAGGTGKRLGGADKARLELHGRRFIDISLAVVSHALGIPMTSTVVIHPGGLDLPAGVDTVLESPPGGGPVAGIAAGVEALHPLPAFVAVLAVDAPLSGLLVPGLYKAVGSAECEPSRQFDVALTTDARTKPQFLPALWRTQALSARLESLRQTAAVRDASLRQLLTGTVSTTIAAGWYHHDVDTAANLEQLRDIVAKEMKTDSVLRGIFRS